MTKYFLMLLLVCLAVSVANATTITDPMQNSNLWSASNGVAVPAYQNMFGDRIGPDDGWFLQDKAPGAWWEYRTTGWNKISSLSISYQSWYGWYNAMGYDLSDAHYALPGRVDTDYDTGVTGFHWQKSSYDLSAYDYRGVRIDTNSDDWSMLVGTVQYEVSPMLEHLISENTVDTMVDQSKWYSADTNTQDDAIAPGNIVLAQNNLAVDPLDPTDGWDAGGRWANTTWCSYKTIPEQTFAQVVISFVKYPTWGAVDASLQYFDGSVWVDVTPTANTGSLGSSWSWFTCTYDLTGINPDQVRVMGNDWSTRIGTVKLSLASDLAPVTFSPDGGRLTGDQSVTISCATPGVTIRYTTDGSDPTETNGTVISSGSSLIVDRPMILKAKAWLAGHNPTGIKTACYQFLLFADDWNDLTTQTPSYSPIGADWTRESGGFSANAETWEYSPSNFYRGQSGTLMFSNDTTVTSAIHVDLGSTVAGTPVEARFKLHQAENAEPTGFYFHFDLRDTLTNKSNLETAALSTGFYGNSGFNSYNNGGALTMGTPGASLHNGWNYLKMIFDPASGVQIWQAVTDTNSRAYDDPTLAYTKVAEWGNWNGMQSVNQFYMDNGNADGTNRPSWKVDDVEVYGVTTTFAPFTTTPAFTPNPGAYKEPQNVVISCPTPGATIRYTTDDTEPTETNGTAITSGATVLVDHPLTLKAKAWAIGHTPSAVKSDEYKFIVFADDWNDNSVFGPSFAQPGVDWSITNGLLSADGLDLPSGFGFSALISGGLMFSNDRESQINVDFGKMAENSTIEARFKLRHCDTSMGNYKLTFGLKDNDSSNESFGYYYEEKASLNPGYYGNSGFHNSDYDATDPSKPMQDWWTVFNGDVNGSALYSGGDKWNFLKITFNPDVYADPYNVEIWQAIDADKNKSFDDPSLQYTRVAHWWNFNYMGSVNQFYLRNEISGVSWIVDDVEIVGQLEAPAAAVATPTLSVPSGVLSSPTNVVISCATSGATIRYTTDGTMPTETNGTVITSGASVTVDHAMVLTARAFSGSLTPSTSISASYAFPTYSRPYTIYSSNAVTVDGDLSDWNGVTWAPLDQVYNGTPTDIAEAYYAARWGDGGQKIYVAVKVRDTAHSFMDSYGGGANWNARDAAEIYIHTTGEMGDYQNNQEPAQQYTIGIKDSDRNQVWASVGADKPIPATAGFTAAGHEGTGADAGWLFYEVALTPFQYFSLSGQGMIVSPLSAGQVIGLDVTAVGHNLTAYTGMKSENTMTWKSGIYGNFGLHLLAVDFSNIGDAKNQTNGSQVACSGTVSAAFADFFYIESTDRTFGIRVNKMTHGCSIGQVVNVIGTIDTLDSGERCINASSVSQTGTDTIKPLGVTNKALGGGQFGLQCGVELGNGLNNIGLLVRTTGNVGQKDTSASPKWFMLDDGSGVSVKVYGNVPSGTPYVCVTGASSCEKDGSNKVQRVIYATSVQTL